MDRTDRFITSMQRVNATLLLSSLPRHLRMCGLCIQSTSPMPPQMHPNLLHS